MLVEKPVFVWTLKDLDLACMITVNACNMMTASLYSQYVSRAPFSERLRRMAESFPVVVVRGARQVGKGAILCATERSLWITEDVAAIPWNQA